MKNLRSTKWFQKLILTLLIPAFAMVTVPIKANPRGGVVVNGAVNFSNNGPNHLILNQKTNSAIINWQDFSIGTGQITQFNQPNARSSVLNRVVTGNPSQIMGQLKANGNVFVVNPNGIVVGAAGVIDTGGSVTLSTLDITNRDFLNGGANRFYGDSTTGVSNFGTISSSGGDVILLGGFVDNQGQIGALNGTIALGSGGDIIVNEASGAKITIQGSSDYTGTGVNNTGTISGVSAELKAHGNVYALAINSGGAIRANGADRSGGRVRLSASGGSSNINLGTTSQIVAKVGDDGGDVSIDAGPNGLARVGGSIDASGIRGGNVSVIGANVDQRAGSTVDVSGVDAAGSINLEGTASANVSGSLNADSMSGAAGTIDVLAREISLSSTAALSVQGETAGGQIRVGGEFRGADVGILEADGVTVEEGATFKADSTGGNAGSVVIWSNNDTVFRGDITANASGVIGNGGLVEVSGYDTLVFNGMASASSVNGNSGTVLLDPDNIFVGYFGGSAGANEIEVATINQILQGGTNFILATQSGNIFIQDFDIPGTNGGGEQTAGEMVNVNDAANTDITLLANLALINDPNHPRNSAIQWTNSNASFGAFASGSVIIENHIRTSGGGSINLMGGWTGGENDVALASRDPEAAWNFYLNNGQFGQNGGSVIVGTQQMNRHVAVGSRYGDTNVAAATVQVSAADTNGESRWTVLGFADSGQTFAPRFNRTDDNALAGVGANDYRLDLNDRANELDNDPLVGIVGNEFFQEVDIDGDGIVDGVYAINSTGVLDGKFGTAEASIYSSATITDPTFIPYAVHYSSSRTGNWWWHHIDSQSPDPGNLGGIAPEHGAGSAGNGADVNVIATASVEVRAGGRHQGGAQIGHGGDSAGWADQRSILNTGIEGGQTQRIWTLNGASNDRSAIGIARVAPVYGDITVLAGVDPGSVLRDTSGNISAEVTGTGSVIVSGHQRLGSANDPTNDERGDAGAGTGAVIGHGGLGQFGSFNGDIDVRAGSDVSVLAGSQTRSIAQIGHSVSGYGYWDPTNNEAAQIRFFASYEDFRDPLLRRGELFSGVTNIDQAFSDDTYIPGTERRRPGDGYGLSDPGLLSAVGLTVEALDGSVLNGMHGNVNVEARTGNVLVRAFNTPDQSDGIDANVNTGDPKDGLNLSRDRRFAKIGHGGSSFAVWAEESGYRQNGTNRFQEMVNFRIPNGDGDSTGSNSVIGEVGDSLNRSLSFMTLTGDIEVTAGGDLEITGGNDVFDFAQVGHGGNELADYETSSFAGGNITVDVGGDVLIEGGGRVDYTGNANGRHQRAQAHLGHGGYRSGFMLFFGDIVVDAGGDITVTGGSTADSFGKIGHQGKDDWAQVGGNYVRDENFAFDSVSTDISTNVTGTTATVDYITTDVVSQHNGTVIHVDDQKMNQSDTYAITSSTANITVTAGGDVTMNHLRAGVQQNDNQFLANRTNLNPIDDAYAQIGHCGQNVDALRDSNTASNYDDKIGSVSVSAGRDVLLSSGNGNGYYTRIGHGGGDEDRVDNTSIFAMELGGTVTVVAGRNLVMDGEGSYGQQDTAHVDPANLGAIENTYEFENDRNFGVSGFGTPSRNNPIQIGHGGVNNNLDIVVLSTGDQINGLDVNSDISISAGGNISLKGGVGAVASVTNASTQDIQRGGSASHVQIGHGFASDLGNDAARRNTIATGFTGDIDIYAGGNLSLQGGSNAYSATPQSGQFAETNGAAAFIGNGGFQLDAPANGEITVFVGQDLRITGQQRAATEVNQSNQDAYGRFNLAKIGHYSAENGQARFEADNPNGGSSDDDVVISANMAGDITVVVRRDAFLTGGQVFSDAGSEIYAAIAQIGHGGPGITGDLEGAITVMVGRNITTVDGFNDPVAGGSGDNGSNNYVMIGHGDWLRDSPAFGNLGNIFNTPADGRREGDIVVMAGRNATFDHTLVGHADPDVGRTTIFGGNTYVAVSRRNPFYGGKGTLTATNGSVFTSAFYGGGSTLQFFMPARSNNKMDTTTRLNEDTTTYVGTPGSDFVGLNGSLEELAGRGDEVFLTPDLWWDASGLGAEAGFTGGAAFPADAFSGQGGSIAEVGAPGGITNLTALIQGSLGTSATIYRDANLTGGTGLYTLYYDAIEAVDTEFPDPPVPPVIPPVFPAFPFAGFLFSDLFDSFNRDDNSIDNGILGTDEGLFLSLGILEAEGDGFNEQTSVERGLDSLFGESQTPFSDEEEEEEDRRKRERAKNSGGGGIVYYVFEPGTNRYSSYRVFGGGN